MLRSLIWGNPGASPSPEESVLFPEVFGQESSSSEEVEGPKEHKEEALASFKDCLPGLRPTRKVRVNMLQLDPYVMLDPEITIGVLAKARQGYTGPWESYKYIPSAVPKRGVQNFSNSRRSSRSRLNGLLWVQLARAVASGDVAAEARVVACIHRLGFSLRPATHGSTIRLLRLIGNNQLVCLYFRRVLGVKQRAIGRLQGAEGLCLLRDYLAYLCDHGLYSQGLYVIQIVAQSSSIISSYPSLASCSGLIYLMLAIRKGRSDNSNSDPAIPDLRYPFSSPVFTALSRAAAETSSASYLASARSSFEQALQRGEGMLLHFVSTTGLLAAILAVNGENAPILALSRLVKLTSTAPSCTRAWELLLSFLMQYKTAISSHFDTDTWTLHYRRCIKGWLAADELSLVAMHEWLDDFRLGGHRPPFRLLLLQIEHWAAAAPKSCAALVLWDALATELGPLRVRDSLHQEYPPISTLMAKQSVYDCLWSNNPFPVSDLDDWNAGCCVHPLLAAEGLNLSWWGKAYFRDPELEGFEKLRCVVLTQNCSGGDSTSDDDEAEEDCSNLIRKTVVELRSILRERKLPVHGSKEKLLRRLELEIKVGKQKEAAASIDCSAGSGSGQTAYYVPPPSTCLHSNLRSHETEACILEKSMQGNSDILRSSIRSRSDDIAHNKCTVYEEEQEQSRNRFYQNDAEFQPHIMHDEVGLDVVYPCKIIIFLADIHPPLILFRIQMKRQG